MVILGATLPGVRQSIAISGLAVGAPIVSLVAFGSTGHDDVYITFSAAEAFADNGWPSNINGDPVEQSTSFLFTLALALLSWMIPLPVFDIGWLVGLLGLSALAFVTHGILSRYLRQGLALCGAAVVVLMPPVSYWAASGAEQTWVAAALLGSIWLWNSRSFLAGGAGYLLLAAAAVLATYLLRPDVGMALLGGVVALALLSRMPSLPFRPWTKRLWLGVLLSILAVALVTILRISITGTVWPQSVMAKVEAGIDPWMSVAYLVSYLLSPWFLATLGLGLLVWFGYRTVRPPLDSAQVMMVVVLANLAILLVRSSPDWMAAGRLWIPLGVVLTVLVMTGFGDCTRPLGASLLASLVLVQAVFVGYWSVYSAGVDSTRTLTGSRPGDRWILEGTQDALSLWAPAATRFNSWNVAHIRDAQFLNEAVPAIRGYLDTTTDPDVTVGTGQGGMVLFFLKQEFGERIRFVDRYSLLDASFSDCPGVTRGTSGTQINYEQWIEQPADCYPPLPDILFDLGSPPEVVLEHYDVVVQQTGDWRRTRAELSVSNQQWLAVPRK